MKLTESNIIPEGLWTVARRFNAGWPTRLAISFLLLPLFFCNTLLAADNLTFTVGQVSGPAGTEVVVPVQVTQFTNINTFQFSLHWTPAVAAFVRLEQFGLTTLTEGNFATNQAANGTLSVSWDDPGGHSQSLAEGATLFAVRLQLHGPVGSVSTVWIDGTPTTMEAADEELNTLAMTVVPGQITINPGTTPTLTFILGQTNGTAGTEALVPVQVTQFTNINSFQFSLHWTPAVATFVGLEQFGLTTLTEGNFATNLAANGTVTVSWDDVGGQSKSLADGSVLFAVRLRLQGNVGAASSVWIDGTPTGMEAVNGALVPVGMAVIPGQVQVIGTTPILTFIIGQTNGFRSTEVLVPVQVAHFASINSFQLSLHWTPAVATLVGLEQFGLTSLTEGNFATNQAANGALTVSWDDPSGQSKTLLDGTTLFALRLQLHGAADAASPIWINGTPTSMEAYDWELESVFMAAIFGQVTIISPPVIAAQPQAQTLCLGTTVRLSVQADGSGPLSYQWRWNGADLTESADCSGVRSNYLTLTGVEATDAGNYSVVISNAYGVMTSTPVTLALNTAPVLDSIQNFTIPNGYAFSFTASAADLDASAQNLTYSLLGQAPSAVLNPSTGVFTWTPDIVSGPGAYNLAVIARDDCSPSLSATQAFAITVFATNHPPLFMPVTNQVAFVLTPFFFTNVVIDPDWPTNHVTFSLGPGCPPRSRVDTNTGVFAYWPGRADALQTRWITIIASDNGQPPLSATNVFSIYVDDYVEFSLGKTVLRAGDTGNVPLSFAASAGVTNVTATIVVSNYWLTGLVITNLAPALQSGTVTPLGPDLWLLNLCAKPGQILQNGLSPGKLQFTALSVSSAFVHLGLSDLIALRVNGTFIPRAITHSGRAVVVNAEPLLESLVISNSQRVLMLYSDPGQNYSVLSTSNLGSSNAWQTASPGPITNLSQVIQPAALSNQTIFFRGLR